MTVAIYLIVFGICVRVWGPSAGPMKYLEMPLGWVGNFFLTAGGVIDILLGILGGLLVFGILFVIPCLIVVALIRMVFG